MSPLPHYLRVAIALTGGAIGCGGSNTPPETPKVSTTDDAAVSTSKTSDAEPSVTTIGKKTKAKNPDVVDDNATSDEYSAGNGPCRCSWDTKASAAPRVCRKGEVAYSGVQCKPNARPKYYPYPVGGPLSPPELSM